MKKIILVLVMAVLLAGCSGELVPPEYDGIISFVSNGDLWVQKLDGSDPVRVTNGINVAEPVISPDGTKIAFHSTRDNSQPDIFVVNVDGTGLTNLTNSSDRERTPFWTADGKQILFESARDQGRGNIWIMDADGSNPVNISGGKGLDIAPAISRDGKTIAFTSNRDDDRIQRLYTMKPDGSDQTMIYERESAIYQARFSPDGQKLTFMSGGVYVIDVDGKNVTRLSAGARPTFSPDGEKILFEANLDNTRNKIYVMNPDGTDVELLFYDDMPRSVVTWAALPAEE